MKSKELATDRLRVYPREGKKLRLLAKEQGGKTMPADIIRNLLERK